MNNIEVAIIGSGSYGSALANLIGENNHKVNIWVRNKNQLNEINIKHTNLKYSSDTILSPNILASLDLEECILKSQIIIFVIPSRVFEPISQTVVDIFKKHNIKNKFLISATKGINKNSFKLMSEILYENLNKINYDVNNVGVLCGPNLAYEILKNHYAGADIATNNDELKSLVQTILNSTHYKVYPNSDMKGVELGGTLKNIYAIAAGILDALHISINTKSILLSRGIKEMAEFSALLGANKLTFLNASGVGDLYATCTSTLSRNHQFGYHLGQTNNVKVAMSKVNGTIEGINTLKQTKLKSEELKINLPIVNSLHKLIFGDGQLTAQHFMEYWLSTDQLN